jgi:hypothetical protein
MQARLYATSPQDWQDIQLVIQAINKSRENGDIKSISCSFSEERHHDGVPLFVDVNVIAAKKN